jgi:hypothetical protein
MPGAWPHPKPRVGVKNHASVVTTGQPKHRHSLRNGVNRLLRARPGETGFCVTVDCASRRVGPEGLTSSEAQAWHLPLGRRAHTPLPSARVSFVWQHARVHRIPRSTSGDDWPNAPLHLRRDGWINAPIFRKTEAEYFSREGFTNATCFGLAKIDLPDGPSVACAKPDDCRYSIEGFCVSSFSLPPSWPASACWISLWRPSPLLPFPWQPVRRQPWPPPAPRRSA